MNHDLDKLAKDLARHSTHILFSLALAAQLAWPAQANDFRRGPVIDLSDPDALAGCVGDGECFALPSNGRETEPSIAVNPTNPKNIVAVWFGGFSLGLVAAVSTDGGKKWQQVPLPGVTRCTGGTQGHAADPWASFSPNGDLYVSCVTGWPCLVHNAVLVSKSSDGGLHWNNPATLFLSTDKRLAPDKPSITADPTDARFAYAIWVNCDNGNRGGTLFCRTADGGASWEPARLIYDPHKADNGTGGPIINVLPNGILVATFTEFKFADDGTHKGAVLSVIRSLDKGWSWSRPIRVADIPVFAVTDLETGTLITSTTSFCCPNPPVAMDPNNGNLYAAWEDTRFSNGQYGGIALSMSSDAGFTWSAPIQVNKTPANIPTGNRQAFIPAVAVASDGTIAVSYYDLRFNDPNPGLPTDYWMVHCHPSATTPATNPANWGNEVRLTDKSFDMETAATHGGTDYFIGDYEGLASVGNDFVAAWTQPHDSDVDSIFFRRIGP